MNLKILTSCGVILGVMEMCSTKFDMMFSDIGLDCDLLFPPLVTVMAKGLR